MHQPAPSVASCTTAQLLDQLQDPELAIPWLREAAKLAKVREHPRLLHSLAEHPNLPEDVLLNLMRLLPWEMLVAILPKPNVTPELQATCTAQLIRIWARMDLPGREGFARKAPKALWNLVWRTAEPSVVAQFLSNPWLEAGGLAELIQVPLTQIQVETLRDSRFQKEKIIIEQVLTSMAESFRDPATDLVLGHAAPWLMALTPHDRLELAGRLSYAPMERLAQIWGSRLDPPA